MGANNNVVTLSFNANTSQAKKEIQGLVSELNSLSTKKIATSFTQDISQDVKEAAREVGKFSTILKEATNIDTGKLDLSKLNKGLKDANTSLPKMASSFKALGSDGVKAFADVVKQINAAEVPLKKTNAMVDKLWTSMKNTVNWQISSSALHGLMSGIQGAFRYAQDLNTSLNNIRIVTGANVEEMAAFAAEANKAAKALSTTTTAYTDASLIYFQQGLSKEEVKERADVTIKMANVTRQSATEVSNQLTAIWNNFDDGTKSLEYYADVLTKLGAATASSTDEIAGGLEKFAAVADTIGLSYEYAASALATITSNTRQSEEVVGTALKTIFARIQGLNLGETLDDGTTLNKYSEALQKVGISIFDSTGQIKKMDDILDEMGSKWQTLAKDQQIALAQTVAGVRQYNQLVSLMDNWNNGDADSMAANLATSYGATGALQDQADIYADSWEAAQKRVKASAEALYQSLIDDEFFINLLDGASKFLDFIKQAIDGLGGMKGLLATISTYILTIARTKFSDELKRLTGPSQKQQAEQAMQMKRDANTELKNMAAAGGASKESQVTAQTYGKVASIQEKLLQNADKMSDQQRAIVADELERYQVLGKIVAEKAKAIDAGDKEVKVLERQLKLQERVLRAEQEADKKQRVETIEGVQGKGNLLNRKGQKFSDDDIDKLNNARSAAGLENLSEEQTRVLTMDNTKLSGAARNSHMDNYQKILAQINAELNQAKATIESINFTPLTQSLEQYKAKSEQVGKTLQTLYPQGDQKVSSARFLVEFDKLDAETQEFIKNTVLADQTWEEFLAELDNVGDNSIAVEQLADALGEVRANAAQQVVTDTGLDPESVNATTMAIDDQIDSTLELTHQREQLAKSGEKIDDDMDKFPAKLPAWQDQVVAAASAVSSFSMALTALGGIWDTLQDPDLTVWEKLGTVFTTLATVVPALVMTWKTLSEAKIKDTIVTALDTAATWANVDATKAEADANREATTTQIAETVSDGVDAAVDGATSGKKKIQGLGDAFKQLGDGAKNAGSKIKGGFTKVINAGKGVLTKYGATIGSVAAGVAVAAVIIGGCVIAFKALNDAYNKNEIAAQKAEAAAKNLSDAYTETKGAYEELKNTISSYESARDGIAELTRGTAEFGDQISQANDEAMKLLDTYGDLIGNRYSVDSDGLIKIDDDALEEIQQKELDKTQQAQSASVIANQRAREARLKADATKMHRDTVKTQEGFTGEDWNETGKAAAVGTGVGAGVGLAVGAGTAIAGAAAGAAAGSVVPVVGTLIGAAAGLIIGGIAGLITNAIDQNSETDAEKEALNSLAEEYHLKGESALTDEKIKEAYGKDLTEEEIAAIRDLCKEINANTIATEAENQAMANQILSDNEKVQNARDVDDVGVFAGAAYGKATEEAMEKYMSDEYQAGFFGKGSDAQKEAWARYAEAQGLGDLKDYKVTDYRKDGGVEYSYTDENGETQKKVISQDEWAAVVAAQDADAAVNEAGEKIVDILGALEEGTVDILTGAKSGDMSALTMGQLGSDNQEIKNMSEEDLHTLGFEGTKDEILAQIAEQQQANIENIKLAGAQYGEAVSGLINNMIDTNDSTISNVTQGTLKAYADTLNELAMHGGEEVMTQFDSGLQGIMDKYSNKSEEIMSLANNIDWSKGEESLQEFNYQLMQIGINIDEGSAEWAALVNAMQNMNTSVVHRDLDSIRSKIADIKSLTKDIEIGSIISDEDYDNLVKYNAELADMFMMTADGYKYIGGGDIGSMADDYAKDQLQQTKGDNAKARAAHDAINNWGWTDGTNFTKEDWYGLANGTDSNESMNAMTNALLENESEHIANMGYDTEYLQELSNTLVDPNATQEQIDAAKAILQQFYGDILTLNENYENEVYDDTKAEEIYASTAATIDELRAMYDAGDIGAEAYDKQLSVLANQASSLEELQRIQASGLNGEAGLDTYEYGQALMNLAENYGNCAEEAEAYSAALLTGDEATIKAAQSALELSVEIGEMAERFNLDAEETENYAKRLSKSLGIDERAAAKLAVANQRLDRGLLSLNENLEDYQKSLKTNSKNSAEWSKTMDALKTDMADMLNLADGSMISDEFAQATLESEDFKKALDGDVEALQRIQTLAADDIMINIVANQSDDPEGIKARWEQLKADFAEFGDIDAPGVDQSQLLASFNEMIAAGNMTKDQIEAALAGLHVSANVKTTYVPQRVTVPQTITEEAMVNAGWEEVMVPGPDGEWIPQQVMMKKKITRTYDAGTVEVDGVVPQYEIEGTEGPGGITTAFSSAPAVTPSFSSTTSGGAGGGGGGGGSTPKKTSDSRKKRSEIVDPYKEVNDSLGRTAHLLSKNNTLAEGLWGAARSAKMRENVKILNQEVALLEEKLAISEAEMNLSRQDLNAAAGVLGVQLQYDADGLVTNIVDVQEALWAKREALLDSFGGEMDEAEQEQLDAFDEYMDNFTSAYDEYENHRQTQMDTEAERLAKQLEAQQVMFDDLNKTLEENVSLIQKDLELVEYYLSKVEDDFFGMAEAAALMVGSLSSANPGEDGQLGGYLDILAEQKRHKEELDAAYAAGEINQAQYIQGLMDCQSAIIEQLSNLNELDKTMKGYYGETLAAAQEELSKYTDMMEHHSEVLEHYSNLLELIGASKDWERMKTVLEAQVSVAENAAAVSKANYEMLAQEAADKKAAWDALGKGLGDELTYEESVIKQQWLDAQAAADEAQNQMLDDAAAWAESLKSLLETELAELADILNESLSGEFGSLDNMMTAMERANSLQEEYLTTTNQVYETNKLMHTAQQEIDKTTNSVAKRRLKQYIDETEQLQNKNKLSQFELDIQKAKYDLLVAEIALEEAQQAKSTVRLQRDSEGNFGYVYTADQNAVAEAEQKLADAQNALYNIGLEGANKYAESYAQTIQEMNDAVTELTEQWQNGEIGSKEEYQQRMLELEEYYGEKLMQYSELHSIALQTDSRVASEAWTKDFAHMTTQTQKWMQNVDVYVQGVEASMDRYQQGIDRVEEYAGLDLDSLKTKTQNIKDENKALAKSITEKDGLLDAMKDEITEVGNLTREYAKLRTEIQGTVDDYEDLLRRMGVDIDTAAAGNPPFSGGETEDPDTTVPETTDPDTTVPTPTDPGTGGGKTISVGGKVNASGAPIYDYSGDTSGEHQYFSSDPIYKVLKEDGDWIQVRHHKLSTGITGWFKKSDVTAMNTGGYTGDWSGSYGKLAFLHQKELVLNAQDTENLLASMDILDKIISTIDLYSSSAQLGGMLSSPRYGGFDNEPLEQNVHIEASFPSVTDHNEIEDALNNLINRASQYAHRN